jgi:hypothetical protein
MLRDLNLDDILRAKRPLNCKGIITVMVFPALLPLVLLCCCFFCAVLMGKQLTHGPHSGYQCVCKGVYASSSMLSVTSRGVT